MRSRYAEERRLVVILPIALLTTFSQIADARTKQPRWDAVADGRAPGELVLGVVALAEQRITLYDAKGPVLRASISSGRNDYETPAGVFGVLQKEAEHYSNRYDDAAMPFMQRITWSGIALHAGPLPGYPASHGCIRLPYKFAEQIFGMTKLGFRVVIARNDVAPTVLSHPVLSNLVPPFPDAAAPKAAAQPPSSDGVAMKLGMPAAPDDPISRLQDIATHKREAAEAATKKADEASAVARAQAPLENVRPSSSSRQKMPRRAPKGSLRRRGWMSRKRSRRRVSVLRKERTVKPLKRSLTLQRVWMLRAYRRSRRSTPPRTRAKPPKLLRLPSRPLKNRPAQRGASCGRSLSLSV